MSSLALLNLSRLLRIPTIAEVILSFLTLADIVILHRLCRALRDAIQSQHRSRLNANHLLGAFVKDCALFRYNLAFYNGLLVGGAILEFLERRHNTVPRLDVLLEGGPCTTNFIDYLCLKEHYISLDDGDSTLVLHRPTSPDRTIHITTSDTIPIHALLRSSCTTADLSFMSWNKIYSIFPLATIVAHKLYPLRPLDDHLGAHLAELSKQGWTSRDIIWLDLARLKVQNIGSRRVGDRHTLAMRLHPVLEGTGQTPDYVLEHAEFHVFDQRLPLPRSTSKFPSRNTLQLFSEELSIRVQELASPALYYQYTTGHGLLGEDWRQYAEQRLKRWTIAELYKIPSSRRPLNPTAFNSPFGSLLSRHELPASWDYADDQMAQWYRQWEEGRK